MANTGFKGINAVQTGSQIVFRASLKTSAGAALTTGTATLAIYELQSDGTLKSYDFSSNTFKTTALTNANENMSQQAGNNGSTNTGIWTYALATLTGFTVGAVYIAVIISSSASPAQQEREFVYGSAEGDLVVTSTGTGTANLNADAKSINAIATSSVTTVGAFIGNATAAIAVNGSGYVTYANAAPPTAAGIATQIFTDLTSSSDFSTAGSFGALIKADINAPIGSIPTNPMLVTSDLSSTAKTSVSLLVSTLLTDTIGSPITGSLAGDFQVLSGLMGYPAVLTVTGPATVAGQNAAGIYNLIPGSATGTVFPAYQGPLLYLWLDNGGNWVFSASIGSESDAFGTTEGVPPWQASWAGAGTYTGSPTVTVPAAPADVLQWLSQTAEADANNLPKTAAYDPGTANDAGTAAIAAAHVTVGGYDEGQDPASLLKAATISNTAASGTIEESLLAARAQGFGKWVLSGTTLDLYAPDGVTVVRSFTLDSASAPTQRT